MSDNAGAGDHHPEVSGADFVAREAQDRPPPGAAPDGSGDGLRDDAEEDDADEMAEAYGEDDDEEESSGETDIHGAIPEEYRGLLGERPTLWYEDVKDYDEFECATFAELRPKGLVECIYARDWAECDWELRRMRRLARSAIYSALPQVASDALAKDGKHMLETVQDQSLMMNNARGSAMGIAEAKEALKTRARSKLLRPVDLHLAAYRNALPLMDAIVREIARLERRRDQILRQLEDRRVSFAAMARRLVERDAAETVEPVVRQA